MLMARAKSRAVAFDRGSPVIVVHNQSKLPDKDVRRVLKAVQRQVDEDFFPLWGWRAKLVFEPPRPLARAMTLIIKGKSSEFDGYHLNPRGLPVGYVFTRDEKDELIANWSVTVSHEVLEMIVDPGANLYAFGHYTTRRSRRRRNAYVGYEVCDAVQEKRYVIDGVKVSDFVVPEWFEPERRRGSMRFSFKRAVHRPFGLAPGGYMDVQVGSTLITVDGPPLRKKKPKKRRNRHEVRRAQLAALSGSPKARKRR
jgi:hypothetical protein